MKEREKICNHREHGEILCVLQNLCIKDLLTTKCYMSLRIIETSEDYLKGFKG